MSKISNQKNAWVLLHDFVAALPDGALSADEMRSVSRFFKEEFEPLIPCEECMAEWRRILRVWPPGYTGPPTSSEAKYELRGAWLREWATVVHDYVNFRIGRNLFLAEHESHAVFLALTSSKKSVPVKQCKRC